MNNREASATTLSCPTPAQTVAACTVGLVGGALAGLAVQFDLGYATVLLALLYGGFLGSVILRVVRQKGTSSIQVGSGVSIVVGSIAARVLAALSLPATTGTHPPLGIMSVLVDLVVPTPIPLISLVALVFACMARMRYFGHLRSGVQTS
ncbi:MAG: hypothetical protein QHI38_07420 [Armatimonadota bacterium]|nr:hypothetical protein [Armatimonadota bacterium]